MTDETPEGAAAPWPGVAPIKGGEPVSAVVGAPAQAPARRGGRPGSRRTGSARTGSGRPGSGRRRPVFERLTDWADDRLGIGRFTEHALAKIFPDHWSFMIGEIAFYCFIILVLTGSYLTFFFNSSEQKVVYHGTYRPLQGATMSEAYKSVVDISFHVRAGLVMRQLHHWAAVVFLAAIVVHLCRIFFTGAFRRPREINWIIGVTLLVLAMGNGFTGYSLPDDLLSGTGLRIMYSIVLSIPFIGSWFGFLFFGGKYPGTAIIQRLFIIHVFFIPALIAVVLTAHLAILWHQKHTDFPGPGKTEDTIHGSRLWPQYTAKSLALFCFVASVLAGLAGLAQINPIWIYGPYHPAAVSAGSQPDWYVGWLDGALRVMPPLEIRAFHHTLANPFFPGVVLPGITFGLLYAWPFLEARFSKDRDAHNLLDRPRDRPLRTAFGVATLTFYTILFMAAGTDVLASTFGLSFETLLVTFQISLLVVPPLMAWLTYRIAKELARQQAHPIQQPVGGRVVRTAAGGYEVAGNGHRAAGDVDEGETAGAATDRARRGG